MISYEAVNEPTTSIPSIVKVISLGGEQYKQRMIFNGFEPEEMDSIPTSVLMQHLDNLLVYMKSLTVNMRVVGLSEPKPDNGDFIVGITDFWLARDEAKAWWQYARMSREPEDS